MREINVSTITQAVKDMCIEANYSLSADIRCAIAKGKENESMPLAKEVLGKLLENLDASEELDVPICQDTGIAVIFLEIGQDVHFVGGNLYDAIHAGVAAGYLEGYLRCSIVEDPLNRVNTDDNTPAVIHASIVDGDRVKITVAPKGFGSENMSAIKMFNPSATIDEIISFVVSTVKNAGPNPCPPTIVGVGIGGTFEKAALLAKKALLRPIDCSNENPFYADLEKKTLEEINCLGIGPQGFGGVTSALGVNYEYYPTHIAGLPVAVNISCHVTRHKEKII